MAILRSLKRCLEFCFTVLLWIYFLFGYFVILLLFFVPSYLHLKNSAAVLQRMNHLHLRCFFAWLGFLAPKTEFKIDADVRGLRSAIIVCNHVSYLDPILLVSLFERHTTIVKASFFSVPIFGWFLSKAGYVPAPPAEIFSPAMTANLEEIKRHLAAGGNLFVFPEGTRSRGDRLLPFNKGVFSIARHCNKGLTLVLIRDTDRLFSPGSFAFHMLEKNTITMRAIATLQPDYQADDFSVSVLADEARQIFKRKMAGMRAGGAETPGTEK
ncbi:MAG: 1-acyl-sn-glycerol-3-phosphate acyltransferase [Deltaproteobacteria bacterium]